MPVYFLVGPAAALIGIVAIFFVMRNRSTQNKSMYSSRRGQIERKVAAARQRTLAPRGRQRQTSTSLPTMAAAAPSAPAYEAPSAPTRQAWEAPAAPAAPAYRPPAPSEFVAPSAAAPPAPPTAPFEPAAPAPAAGPEWTTPAPSEAAWTPAPAPAYDAPATPAEPAQVEPAAQPAEPPSYPAGGGASWEIIGEPAPAAAQAEPAKGKKDKEKDRAKGGQQQQTGGAWSLASGNAPGATADEGDEEVKKPSAAMALAQYAVLVVGLVMVLIGVLVMVANSKVT